MHIVRDKAQIYRIRKLSQKIVRQNLLTKAERHPQYPFDFEDETFEEDIIHNKPRSR